LKLIGAGGQKIRHHKFDASSAILTGGTPQLALAQRQSCSSLYMQNTSATGNLYFEIGGARAIATLTSGVVTSISVTGVGIPGYPLPNAGFNYTYVPKVRFWGGGNAGNSLYLGLGQPGGEAPEQTLTACRKAKAQAVLTAGAVSSFVIEDGGAGYACAPFVFLENSDLDPNGVAAASPTSGGIMLTPNESVTWNGTVCPTDALSVYGATTGQTFTLKWMD
jgi:hypothetical protein